MGCYVSGFETHLSLLHLLYVFIFLNFIFFSLWVFMGLLSNGGRDDGLIFFDNFSSTIYF